MRHPETPWTDTRIESLRALWAAGPSASEIGKELGLSRNSILAKVYRLKLPLRVSGRKKHPASNRLSRSKAAKEARAKARAAAKAAVKLAAAQAITPVTKPAIPPKAKPVQPTKNELRAMLAQAVRNTAAIKVPA